MPKIQRLPLHEAQKIAAGEVVERPSTIVKELIENSIDAGANHISIYIEDGGKQLIRIVDNGCGMDAVDARQCFDRYATSKITQVQELESINTFGFRGEALASIAAVSLITLITKEEYALEGICVAVKAGTIENVAATACIIGTDITVKDLFFNVPARKKFLKSTQTEWRSIQLLVQAFCFDYPHIHFSLFTENKQVLNCPATTTLFNRVLQLWDQPVHKNLIELSVTVSHDISVSGIIADFHQYRYDRSSIYIFVNKRWVKNHQLTNAVIKSFANTLPPARYPLAIIAIDLPGTEVDINIHPRKEEVKFLHPRRVELVLQDAVKKALESKLSQRMETNTLRNEKILGLPFDTSYYVKATQDAESKRKTDFIEVISIQNEKKNEINSSFMMGLTALHEIVEKNVSKGATSTSIPFYTGVQLEGTVNWATIIGQYKNTYILIEQEDGLFFIDQHAAHERILYELFSQRFHEVATVQLIFPHIITLSEYEINIMLDYFVILHNNGIIIEQYGPQQLIIQSLPVHFKEQAIEEIIKDILAWIVEYASLEQETLKKTINNKLQAQMACKAAVKAGDVLSQEKMEQLVHDLSKTANRFSCPHGRPTGWLLSLHEIEKKFKRRL